MRRQAHGMMTEKRTIGSLPRAQYWPTMILGNHTYVGRVSHTWQLMPRGHVSMPADTYDDDHPIAFAPARLSGSLNPASQRSPRCA